MTGALDSLSNNFESVAIVHDYLNQRGGAERVVLEMAKIWPEAPLYTSLYRHDSTYPEFERREVRTSPLDRLPVDRRFRGLLPLYPAAFKALGTLEHDLVISSSSGWAHAVRTAPSSLHVVYCYAPARWLYRSKEYLGRSLGSAAAVPLSGTLRRWDFHAAHRADAYAVIAENVRERVHRAYGIDATVVHPPVDVARFSPSESGNRLLVVSRLLPYKRVDLAVRAATQLGLGLDVVGTGSQLEALRGVAGPQVTFHGEVSDAALRQLYSECWATCLPGQEDFGLVPVEGLASGKPCVAFRAGGATETIVEGVTGTFFDEPTSESLAQAIRRLAALSTDPAALAASADRFSAAHFAQRFQRFIGDARERRDRRYAGSHRLRPSPTRLPVHAG